MTVLVVGISHRSAPIALLEKLAVDTDGATKLVMRDDVEQPCLDRDEVLAEAPQAEDGRFRVPPVIGIEV